MPYWLRGKDSNPNSVSGGEFRLYRRLLELYQSGEIADAPIGGSDDQIVLVDEQMNRFVTRPDILFKASQVLVYHDGKYHMRPAIERRDEGIDVLLAKMGWWVERHRVVMDLSEKELDAIARQIGTAVNVRMKAAPPSPPLENQTGSGAFEVNGFRVRFKGGKKHLGLRYSEWVYCAVGEVAYWRKDIEALNGGRRYPCPVCKRSLRTRAKAGKLNSLRALKRGGVLLLF